ncbi:MAG: YhcH/YjgK/YiaL family protein [Chloroflexi bacterium HGW-Chloroflexi-10]|nr:MAG: YhcH/YjgK/YiaL family protein [Chloroflexi bacterium HGW-Chloroflexi-10]
MILDTLNNHTRYSGISHNLFAALKFLFETDLTSLPIGRTDIDGDNLFALVQEYDTKSAELGKWEAHRKYIDVQYILSGRERMGFANIYTMDLGDYLPEKDFQAMSGEGNTMDLSAGDFAIFFPEDGHKPCLCVTAPERVKKVVIKVKIA